MVERGSSLDASRSKGNAHLTREGRRTLAVLSVSGRQPPCYDVGIMQVKLIACALVILPALGCPSQTAPSQKDELAQHERAAQQFLREQHPDLAIPEFQKVVALDPANIQARANLGVLLFFRGAYADAIPQLKAALETQPELWKVRSLLGFAEERTSDIANARKDLEASFPKVDEQKLKIEVGLDLVGLYTSNSELDKAAALVSQLKAAYPEVPEVLYAAYRTYADLSGEAMISLSMVSPDSAQMHQLLAHEETREGNTNGAIAQYRRALAIDPHLPGVHFELAELLHSSDLPAAKSQAEQEYRAAISENPMDEKALCALADMSEANGDFKTAFENYSKAVALQPDDANAKLGLAKVLIDMGQPDKALPILKESIQLEPTNAVAHYRLGMLYRKTGQVDEAKREIELFQQYKAMKDKLRTVYKELQVQPDEIRSETDPETKSPTKP